MCGDKINVFVARCFFLSSFIMKNNKRGGSVFFVFVMSVYMHLFSVFLTN